MANLFCRSLLGALLFGLVATGPSLAPAPVMGAAYAATTAAGTETPQADLEAWNAFATRAEAQIADQTLSTQKLETLRGELATWRETLLSAQSANGPRIANLREQISALGAPPAEGATEPEELATRRKELTEQLATAQAPGLAAEEAYRRADGLIRETDTILRTRDAELLLRRDPAPVNPANWPSGFEAVTKFTTDLWGETSISANSNWRRQAIKDALPVLAIAVIATLIAWWQGRRGIERLIHRLQDRLPRDWWGVIELPISLLQVALPLMAVTFLSQVLLQTNALGALSKVLLSQGLFNASLIVAVVLWLGWHIFPVDDRLTHVLNLPSERRAEGRFHITLLALAIGVEALVTPVFSVDNYGLGAQIITYPVTVLVGVLLFRLGQLLTQSAKNDAEEQDNPGFGVTITSLIGKAAMLLGVAGPVLGAVGYVGLSEQLVRPAMASLGLVGVFALLQRLIYDLYALATRSDAEKANQALLPVLVSFLLALLMVPVMALIWGMRVADLLEYWTRFREGFQIGETRISPTDFIILLIVFGVGYGLTKLLQGALKSTILPRTSIDTGGQNAIVSGTGYVGYVLAALASISAAGLNMSSLAMLASALSVGIGFGLQNIVQNFVSGIILLVERPVSEGDWVEVGGVQGIVRRISIRSTRVETFDRTSVIVPNASLISSSVTNFTGFNLNGRLIVPVSVGYDVDSRKVAEILQEIAEAQPMVILNPPPTVPLVSYGGGLLNFEIRMILRDINASMGVRSEINHMIIQRFSAEGITLPATTREVRTFVQIGEDEINQALEQKALQSGQTA